MIGILIRIILVMLAFSTLVEANDSYNCTKKIKFYERTDVSTFDNEPQAKKWAKDHRGEVMKSSIDVNGNPVYVVIYKTLINKDNLFEHSECEAL